MPTTTQTEKKPIPSDLKNQIAVRSFAFDLREDAKEGMVSGYAAVFNQRVAIGNWFTEEIAEGAFDNADLSDVRFFVNHDWSKLVLARHRRGKRSTMEIKPDKRGLYFSAELDIDNNSDAKNLYSAVKRGDILGVSIAMRVGKEEWDDLDKEMPKRKILEIASIFEISPVNDPAYSNTDIAARSAPLDNDKSALDNARAGMLDNRKRAEKLELEKQKLLILLEDAL
jgi:HK97 family phage prohead protease